MSKAIASVRVRTYRLEFAQPYVTARGQIGHRDVVELELTDSDGATGRGETTSLSLRGGTPAFSIVSELTGAGSRLLTEARSAELGLLGSVTDAARGIEAIAAEGRARGLTNEALSAIDLALFDLAGKRCEAPVWRLLGAKAAAPVLCNATLVAGEPAAVAAGAIHWASQGFTTFKVKAGLPGDVEVVDAVREAVGDDAQIRVDANGAWTLTEAIEKLKAMGGDELIELAEQPCADVLALAKVREASGVTIAADESVVDADTAAAVAKLGAVDVATVKLAKVGGLSSALAIADHLPVYVSSALDGPIGIAAAVHLVQALRSRGQDAGVAHGLATQRLFDAWPESGPELRAARLEPSDRPGI